MAKLSRTQRSSQVDNTISPKFIGIAGSVYCILCLATIVLTQMNDVRFRRVLVLLAILLPLDAQHVASVQEPKILSLFPMGGSTRGRFQSRLRGTGLGEAYAVSFDAPGLSAKIAAIQEIQVVEEAGKSNTDEKKVLSGQSIQLDLEIGSAVAPGVYSLRVLSRNGISNPLPFLVSSGAEITETPNPHDRPEQAQEIKWPVIVDGLVSKPGESDFYAFQVREGEELSFEVFSKPIGETPANKPIQSGFDSQLILYEAGGSWFDPDRVKSLAFNDDPVFASIDANARFTYRFKKQGRYLIEVRAYPGESVVAPGAPDYCYQLLIGTPGRLPLSDVVKGKWETLPAHSSWREQSFARKIKTDRMGELRSRSLVDADKPEELAVPGIVQGVIAHSGLMQSHKFKVNSGERLAFEIETSGIGPPQFTPLLTVVDAEGKEVFSNVYLRIGRNPNYRKTVQPKVLHTFEAGGEFTAQIRDITSRYGNAQFRYRLLIRQQVPHIGEIEVSEHFVNSDATQVDYPVDRINLYPGIPKRLNVRTSLEEGFTGNVIVRLEGLPAGVEVLPSSETEADDTPPLDQGDRHRFLPKISRAAVTLMAQKDCSSTATPYPVRVVVTPVRPDGTFGNPLAVQSVPLMVIKPGAKSLATEVSQTER